MKESIQLKAERFAVSALRNPLVRALLIHSIVFVSYYVMGTLGLKMGAVSGFASSIWAPTGIAIAAVLLTDYSILITIFCAAFAVNWTLGASFLPASGVALGNMCEAWLAAYLLRSRLRCDLSFSQRRDVLLFILFGAIVSTALSPTVGVTSLWLGGHVPKASFLLAWFVWWLGDAMGALVVAPFILVLSKRRFPNRHLLKNLEFILLSLLAVLIPWILFSGWLPQQVNHRYLVLPLTVWSAVRFRQFGAVYSTLLISVVSIIGTLHADLQFHDALIGQHLFELQLFMAVIAISGMILAATVAEQKETERQLQNAQKELEARVKNKTVALQESNRARKKTEEIFRLLVNEVKDYAILMVDPNGKIASWNEGAKRIKGYEGKEVIGKHISIFYDKKEAQNFKPDANLQEAILFGRHETEGWRLRKDGSRFWASVTITPFKDERTGNLLGFSKVTRDMTERKRAEDRLFHAHQDLENVVQQRTAELARANQELARSNQELEQFAYIASHDLKEPLRMIAAYVELLRRSYKGHINETADSYIEFVVEGVQRMNRLIRDLLIFSQVGNEKLVMEPSDMNPLVADVIENLNSRIQESKAIIECSSLPIIPLNAIQISQVFQNLLSNALKFRRSETPLIRIGAKKQRGEWIFSVSDNGIGMDSRYLDRIFVIFQRLHTQSEYPGTGIGLSICKKIIERHGGRIWVESKLGEGSTFYLSLPEQIKNLTVPRLDAAG